MIDVYSLCIVYNNDMAVKESFITTYNSLQRWLHAPVTYLPLSMGPAGYIESPQSLFWATLLKAQASAKRLRWIPLTTKIPTCMQISECKFDKGTSSDMIWYDMIWYDMIWYDEICRDHLRSYSSTSFIIIHSTSCPSKPVCLLSWDLHKTRLLNRYCRAHLFREMGSIHTRWKPELVFPQLFQHCFDCLKPTAMCPVVWPHLIHSQEKGMKKLTVGRNSFSFTSLQLLGGSWRVWIESNILTLWIARGVAWPSHLVGQGIQKCLCRYPWASPHAVANLVAFRSSDLHQSQRGKVWRGRLRDIGWFLSKPLTCVFAFPPKKLNVKSSQVKWHLQQLMDSTTVHSFTNVQKRTTAFLIGVLGARTES